MYLPRTDEYLKYTSLKGERSDRFKQSLIKLITLVLQERSQARVLAGTVVTPTIMTNLYELVLEKINSGAKFLNTDIMDNLFAANIRQNLTEYAFFFNENLNEIERNNKIEDLVEAISSLTEEKKIKLNVLVEQSENERQKKIVKKEWEVNKINEKYDNIQI